VFLAESARGLTTQYEVLKGNPVDEVHVAPSLRRHRRTFRHAPQLYGADRGFFSERNVTVCVHGGVATVSIPQRGGSKTPQRRDHERSVAFKQRQRFRAGIEGRISVLMRGRGMKRCRAEGAERFALFVAAAVLANNLMIYRRTADQTLQTPPQNRPTISQLTSDAVKQTAVLVATPSTTAPRRDQPARKIAREALANSPAIE
jgi:IS5 family transposase